MSLVRPVLSGALSGVILGPLGAASRIPALFDWRADLAAPIPAGFTFTRASSHLVFDGDAYQSFGSGVIPLIAGTQKGYFSDPARTNKVFFSSDFTDNGASSAGWDVSGAVVLTNLGADAIGRTAWDLDNGNTTASHTIFNRATATVLNENYVYSVIAKYVDWPHMILRQPDGGATIRVNFNLQTGLVTASTGVGLTFSRMTLLSNGWYLCELGWTAQGASASPNLVICHGASAADTGSTVGTSFLGTDTSFKLIHAQDELTDDNIGAVTTSPIATSGGAAARAACVLSGASGLGITPAVFTFNTSFRVPSIIPSGKRVVALAAGSNVALIQVTDAGLISMFDGTTTTTIAGDERGNTVAAAVSFDGTTLRLSKNGGTPVTLVPAATPVGQAIQIGHQTGDRQLRGFFHRATAYAQAMI